VSHAFKAAQTMLIFHILINRINDHIKKSWMEYGYKMNEFAVIIFLYPKDSFFFLSNLQLKRCFRTYIPDSPTLQVEDVIENKTFSFIPLKLLLSYELFSIK